MSVLVCTNWVICQQTHKLWNRITQWVCLGYLVQENVWFNKPHLHPRLSNCPRKKRSSEINMDPYLFRRRIEKQNEHVYSERKTWCLLTLKHVNMKPQNTSMNLRISMSFCIHVTFVPCGFDKSHVLLQASRICTKLWSVKCSCKSHIHFTVNCRALLTNA